jgi:hypothetical protein
MIKRCLVCYAVLPTNYRGRPRKTCSTGCHSRRRVIRRANQERLESARDALLEAVSQLKPWHETRVLVLDALYSLTKLDDEVSESQISGSENTGPDGEQAREIEAEDALQRYQESSMSVGEYMEEAQGH